MRNKIAIVISSFILSLAACSTVKDTVVRDGSSFEKAFKVKDIGEEYEISRKLCPACQLNGQALMSKKNKPYDVLSFTKPDGEKVSYYFDISSFYGKW